MTKLHNESRISSCLAGGKVATQAGLAGAPNFLTLCVWGVVCQWNKMFQSFNSHLSEVVSAEAAPPPKKRHKKRGKLTA